MIYLSILLLSLLFTGVVEAETLGQKAIREAGDKWVPCERLYGPPGQECRVNGDAIQTRATPKKVIFEYDDVIKIMADKEHREKLLHQCKAGDAILVQIGKEKDRKIELLEGQVKNLLETAETQERLGATEVQINEALQKQLSKVTADLDAEKSKKYWWAGISAVNSAAIVTAIFLWVVN